jgi:hypothetical protein
VRVTRISEKLEQNDEAVRFIAQAALVPGSEATIIDRDATGVRIKSETGEHLVPKPLADQLWVSAA